MTSVKHVNYAFGIGFLGIYDFGTTSAYTMVDTAAVIFVAAFTFLAFMRSWIVKILYLVMTECVSVNRKYGTHELFYAILPLTTDFLYAHKLYVFYIYGNVLMGTLIFMVSKYSYHKYFYILPNLAAHQSQVQMLKAHEILRLILSTGSTSVIGMF